MIRKIVAVAVPGPTRAEFQARVRTRIQEDRIIFDERHFVEQISDRGLTTRQVYDVLAFGAVIEDPYLDEFGEWRALMKRKVAGVRIKVAVALGAEWLTVVTAFPA